MTALIIVSLFFIPLLLVTNKRGMEFYDTNGNWIQVAMKLLVVISFGIFVFDGYGSFEYAIWPDFLNFESSPHRMLFFTMWMMLVTKSIRHNNSEYMLTIVIAGLLLFSSTFTSSIITLGLAVSMLPAKLNQNKVAIRIMYLLVTANLIINALSLNVFSTSDAHFISVLVIMILIRFNFKHENDNNLVLPALYWVIIGNTIFMNEFSGPHRFFTNVSVYPFVGLILVLYESVLRKRVGIFALLPAIILVVLPQLSELKLYSHVVLLFPLFWYFLIQEDDLVTEVGHVEKISLLIVLFTIGMTPFTPGGWSLNMLLGEIVTAKAFAVELILPIGILAMIVLFGLGEAYSIIKKEAVARETEANHIINIVLTLVVFGFLYYASIPDIFSESSAFKYLSVLGSSEFLNSATPWRTKNLIFMLSIFSPIIIFGIVYWREKKSKVWNTSLEKIKMKMLAFTSGRMPFLQDGFAVKSHLMSVRLRNRSELILRGALYTPTVFTFEVIGTLGSYLGKLRPKGINSNLLYSIIITSLVLIFYLRKLL